MYVRSLRKAVHTRRFSIRPLQSSGWEVREENDAGVVKHVLTDWHRVERAIAHFKKEEETLRARGWIDEPAASTN